MVTNPGFGQYSPPDVAALGEGGRLDDLGCHPGVGAGGAHLGGLVPLPGQAEVGDLQRQTLHTFILYGLSQQDWTREGREGRKTDENSQRIDHFTISLHHCKDLFHTFIACKKQKKPTDARQYTCTNDPFLSHFLFLLFLCHYNPVWEWQTRLQVSDALHSHLTDHYK